MPDEKFADQKLSDEICGLLGKSPTWNTRDGIRKLLMNQYNIEVRHWNTGDRGSKKNAPAEFSVSSGGTKYNIDFDQVTGIIKGDLTISDVVSEVRDDSSSIYDG